MSSKASDKSPLVINHSNHTSDADNNANDLNAGKQQKKSSAKNSAQNGGLEPLPPTSSASLSSPPPTSSHSSGSSLIGQVFKRPFKLPKLEGLSLIICSIVVFSLAVTLALIISILAGVKQVYEHGAALTDQSECSQLARDLMHRDSRPGSAMDAALSAFVCLSVTRPDLIGAGGYGLLLLRNQRTRTSLLVDMLPTVPKSVTATANKSAASRLVGVPNVLAGLRLAHARFGKLSWHDAVLAGLDWAIKTAKKNEKSGESEEFGEFRVSPQLADHLAEKTLPKAFADFWKTRGGLKTNATLQPLPSLIAFWRRIADESTHQSNSNNNNRENNTTPGAAASSNKNALLEELRNVEALKWWSLDERAVNSAKLTTPFRSKFSRYSVLTAPAPSRGGIAIGMALNALNKFTISSKSGGAARQKNGSSSSPADFLAATLSHNKYLVPSIEAFKLAEAAASRFAASTTASSASNDSSLMQSAAFIAQMADKISANQTHPDAYYAPFNRYDWFEEQNANIVINDPDNLYVAFVGSLGSVWGSGIATKSGVVLNDAMRLFRHVIVEKGGVEKKLTKGPRVGQRAPSSLTPLFALNTKRRCGVRFAASASGGVASMADLFQFSIYALLVDRPSCKNRDCLDIEAALRRARWEINLLKRGGQSAAKQSPPNAGVQIQVEKSFPSYDVQILKNAGFNVSSQQLEMPAVHILGKVEHDTILKNDPRASPLALIADF